MRAIPVELRVPGAAATLTNCDHCQLPVLRWKDNILPSKSDLLNAQKLLSRFMKEDVVIRKGGTEGNYYVLLQSLFR